LTCVSKIHILLWKTQYLSQGVPCVFGLLMNKKAGTYKQIFAELKAAALKKNTVFSPSVIMTDFETGSISAVKDEVGICTLIEEKIL
jgi:MULE transposase domain